MVYLELSDERALGFPADRYKLLKTATDEQLHTVELRLDSRALR